MLIFLLIFVLQLTAKTVQDLAAFGDRSVTDGHLSKESAIKPVVSAERSSNLNYHKATIKIPVKQVYPVLQPLL